MLFIIRMLVNIDRGTNIFRSFSKDFLFSFLKFDKAKHTAPYWTFQLEYTILKFVKIKLLFM